MVKATFEQAREFLDEITSKEKVGVIHDVDTDGMSSAVLMTDYLSKKGIKWKNFCFYRGISTFKDFDLGGFDKFIILDLGTTLFLEEIGLLNGRPTVYIDHHQVLDKNLGSHILEYKTSGGICTARSVFEMVGGKKWLAIVGIISDAGDKYLENNKIIKDFFEKKNWNQKDIEEKYIWKYGSLLMYFDKDFQKAFEIFQKLKNLEDILKYKEFWGPVEEEKEILIKEYYNKHEKLGPANYFYFEPHFNVKSIIINRISFSSDPDEVFVFAMPKGENRISVSTRCQGDSYNMDELVKAGIVGLHDSGGGGHPNASSCFFITKDLQKFKENVLKFFGSHKKVGS
ncbi:MAG: DHH family phosphoesterase [archaeon]|nr:DHH family phosphoesterase [archaeon]MCR4323663.1 DHH family phosphoesterase [Nanoarchaeota archaeon]